MDTFNLVIEHNDVAVFQMLNGDFESSSKTLRGCLPSLKECILQVDSTSECRNGDSKLKTSAAGELGQPSLPATLEVLKTEDHDLFIFNVPIHFGRLDLSSIAGGCPDRLSRLLSAGIIFNMALLLHVRGRMGVDGALSKAQRLYLHVAKFGREEEPSGFILELAFAALNNALQVSLELGDCSRACEIVELLQGAVAFLPYSEDLIERALFEEILKNIISVTLQTNRREKTCSLLACAPAA